MSRLLISVAALFSLLTVALLPSPALARRCDDSPPETLLSLYKASSEIHFGNFDRVEDGGVIETGEGYTVIEIKKHFSISTTLKGEPRKFFVLPENEYRYEETNELSESNENGEMGEEDGETDLSHILKPGDEVMLFLKKDEETGNLIVAHYRDAIKKLSADQKGAYEKRVGELNSIFSKKKVDDAEVVQWLVEAAIDPETRWEGAFELLSGFQSTEWRAERARAIKEKEEKGEVVEDWEREDLEMDESHAEFARTAYIKLLSDSQKRSLLEAAFNRQVDEGEKLSALSEGDRVLIDLVSRWGDDRLAAYLVEQLRTNPAEVYYNAQLMGIVAKSLGNDRLDKLAGNYGNLYYDDNEPVSDEDLLAYVAETTPSGEDGAPLPQITYGKLKADLMAEFISLSEKLMTTARN
ncbi:MAG: hypothetical protein QUS14_11235 [Pyrinomonadaceae bacterium]|nr:hypothetical protein [Pyrinomonadaceae bacterium]